MERNKEKLANVIPLTKDDIQNTNNGTPIVPQMPEWECKECNEYNDHEL